MVLATEEKALLAFDPTRRIVPTTNTKITASITAYSAMSCPLSSVQSRGRRLLMTEFLSSRSDYHMAGSLTPAAVLKAVCSARHLGQYDSLLISFQNIRARVARALLSKRSDLRRAFRKSDVACRPLQAVNARGYLRRLLLLRNL